MMGSWGKNKSHSRKMTLLESEPGKATERERERENGRVFETQCCVTASSPCCQWQQVKRAALLQLVYPADLAGWGKSICACLSLCYREGRGHAVQSPSLWGSRIKSAPRSSALSQWASACKDMDPYVPVWVLMFIWHLCCLHRRFWIWTGLFH